MTTNTNRQNASVGRISELQIEAERLRAEAIANMIIAAASGIGRLFSLIVRLGKRGVASLQRRREADRIVRELSRMTDRDLADIGLGRGDIMAVANGSFVRPARPVAAAGVVDLRPVEKPETSDVELPRAA
ncbi:DUF1127 domain-containing protein [Microbaculum sp. FT89]|uniref:DUF1127 domain-containing protein n=1 Tax=Microbaculum sp. FT89 TaxID=3447298 RepID=UPI003F53AE4C